MSDEVQRVTARSGRREQLQKMLVRCKDGSAMEERAAFAKEIEERLVRAYGPPSVEKAAVLEFKRMVHNEVNAMLRTCTRSKVSEQHLRRLEDEVRRLSVSSASKLVIPLKFKAPAGDEALPPSSHQRRSDLPDDDYQVLIEADRVEFLASEQRKRNMELKKKAQVRQVLDEQVAACRAQREAERKMEEAYGNELLRQVQEHRAQALREKEANDARNRLDKEMRDKQLSDHKQALARAEQRQKREENRELQRIRDDLDAEKRTKQAKVREQAEYMKSVQIANEQQKKIRDEQKLAEWEDDRRRSEQHAELLALAERKRQANLESIKSRSSRNQQQYIQATAARDAKLREDEERAERCFRERVAAEERQLAMERERRSKDLHDMHATLSEQIAHRERKTQEEREAFLAAAREARQEAERQREIERKAAEDRQRKAEQLREALDEQVRSKRSAEEAPTKMSEAERLFNAPRFREVDGDPVLREAVKRGFKQTPKELVAAAKEQRRKNLVVKKDYHF